MNVITFELIYMVINNLQYYIVIMSAFLFLCVVIEQIDIAMIVTAAI